VVELDERRIILTGTVEDLYQQWSEVSQSLLAEQSGTAL
jgi:hypothetical protein